MEALSFRKRLHEKERRSREASRNLLIDLDQEVLEIAVSKQLFEVKVDDWIT